MSNEPGYTAPDVTLIGNEHVKRYRETDGEVGGVWNGAPALILTTNGRKSGEKRDAALICALDNDAFLIVASMGGAPVHPQWYHNLVADPNVEVQYLADRFEATARTATAQERPGLWKKVTAVWPNYDVYVTRTTREIPVVVLERKSK